MSLIRQLIGEHEAKKAKEGAGPPLSASPDAAPTRPATPVSKPNQYDLSRDLLTAAIENGGLNPKTVFGDVLPMPYSAATGRPYHGQNVFTLAMIAQGRGYASGAWCTIAGANQRGWRVRKGETHTKIFGFRQVEVETGEEDPESGDPIYLVRPQLRHFKVFNYDQLETKDGMPVAAPVGVFPPGRAPTKEAVALLERVATGMGLDVHYDPAALRPELDDSVLTVPSGRGALDAVTVSHLARGLLRVSMAEALPRLQRGSGEEANPTREAEIKLRTTMAEAMLSMRLGFPLEGGAPFDPLQIQPLLAARKMAGMNAANDAETVVKYLMSFDPALRKDLEHEATAFRDEILDAGGDEVTFDADMVDFDYVEERTRVRIKP